MCWLQVTYMVGKLIQLDELDVLIQNSTGVENFNLIRSTCFMWPFRLYGLHKQIGLLSRFLTSWTNKVTVITNKEFEPAIFSKLKRSWSRNNKSEVISVARSQGKLKAVKIKDGGEISCDGIFLSTAMRAASNLASTLCNVDDFGFAKTDARGKTSWDGVWVIGNASDPIGHLTHSIAAGTRVAPMVTNKIIEQSIKDKMS